jgi:hypothetical protein
MQKPTKIAAIPRREWRARLGSNQQPLPSEGSTLSIELRAHLRGLARGEAPADRRMQGPCETERIPGFRETVHRAGGFGRSARMAKRIRKPHTIRVNARRSGLPPPRLLLSVPSIIDRAFPRGTRQATR